MKNDDDLQKVREAINDIDDRILALLNRRAELAVRIGKIKSSRKAPFHAPQREREIYDRLSSLSTGPFPSEGIKAVFREIISASLSLEEPLKVAYLGPPGTFTYIAGLRHFGFSALHLPYKNIPDVFEEVERGRADYGVVPIEHSIEGVLTHTLDIFAESKLKICAEILQELSLDLMSRTGEMGQVKKIYSNPDTLAMCRDWLQANLAGVPIVDAESSARAVEAAAADPTGAAIAGYEAGKLYDLKTIEKRIENSPIPFTRFLVIGTAEMAPTGNDKTSIMMTLTDDVGTLHQSLQAFIEHRVNLTRIESRPLKGRAGEYFFFVDIEGHYSDEPVKKAIVSLEQRCLFVKMLGSYSRRF